MLSGQDIVLLYAPPWNAPTQFSKHHLARHLASNRNRVLYVESPLTPLALRRGTAAMPDLVRTLLPSRQIGPTLWLRRHFLPIPYHSVSTLTSRRQVNAVGQRLLAPVIRRDMRRLGFGPTIVIAGLPHAVDALDALGPRLVVYHCSDDFAHVRGFPSTLPALEAELCRRADLVVTTSDTLCQARREFNSNTHWIPNGVDVRHFGQTSLPAVELREMRRPIVGFVGGLSQWFDVQLVAELARARPAWTFVLVGPASVDVEPLRQLANVELMGPRPYRRIPEYLAAMDVAIVPFTRDPVTWHADPIKVYEYLAAGVPVVATEMPALGRLQHVVRLADSTPAFLQQLDAAIAEGREARRADREMEAARHAWSARFERFDELVVSALSGGSSS